MAAPNQPQMKENLKQFTSSNSSLLLSITDVTNSLHVAPFGCSIYKFTKERIP